MPMGTRDSKKTSSIKQSVEFIAARNREENDIHVAYSRSLISASESSRNGYSAAWPIAKKTGHGRYMIPVR